MADAFEYKPSWKNISKYGIYIRYLFEYLRHRDFKSLVASLRYVLTHRLPGNDYETKSGMGKFLIRGRTTDFQFINYAYEKSVKDYISSQLDTFDIFIDLGACIGEYNIWLGQKGKRCIAVEPVNYKGLQRNVQLNKLEHCVQVYSCGVGAKKERVYFEVLEGVTSSSHIDRSVLKEPNVDIETLDDIVKRAGISPSDRVLMKLDVEGMECEVIEGGKEFIRAATALRIIYEHFKEDEFRNDKALLALADFEFVNLDAVNRLAIKK
jgi:FkbM family methyltransferase